MADEQAFVAAIGAGIAGTVAGVSAMVMSKNMKESNEKELKYQKVKQRKEQYMEDQRNEAWHNQAEEGQRGKKQKRHVELEFDSDDNCTEKQVFDSDGEENYGIKIPTPNDGKSRVKYNTGDEAYNIAGKTNITDDIFEPEANKETNAAIFFDNWTKVKNTHYQEAQKQKLMPGLADEIDDKDRSQQVEALDSSQSKMHQIGEMYKQSSNPPQEKQAQGPKIMNIDPAKMKKKDQMFMDFFSMYGKNFINSKKDPSGQQQKAKKKPTGSNAFRDLMTNMAQGNMQQQMGNRQGQR